MLRLDELPAEVLGTIAEYVHDLDLRDSLVKPNLLSLVATSRRIYAATSPCLYQKFIYHGSQDPNGHRLRQYIISSYSRSHGQHLCEIILEDWYWPMSDKIWMMLDLATASTVYTPDTLGFFLCQASVRLRKLVIDYPPDGSFLNINLPSVQELYVRPIYDPWDSDHIPGGRAATLAPIDGSLKVDSLCHVLKWPRLQHLSLEAISIYDDDSLCDFSVQPRSSPITCLKLRVGNFGADALSQLCNALITLETFIYVPTVQEDLFNQDFDTGSLPEELPRTSEVAQNLLAHADCLQSLDLARAGSCWTERIDKIDSLHNFIAMTSLRIDATMLLGWKHCQHNSVANVDSGYPTDDAASTWAFGTFLPPLIKDLTVVIDRHLSQQEQARYITMLIEGIAAEIALGKLIQLQHLRLEPTDCQYCALCTRQIYDPRRHLHLPNSEKARLSAVLSQTGCELDITDHLDIEEVRANEEVD